MTSAASSSEGPTAQQRADRIERLLDEIQAMAGPTLWPRIEALVAALVELQGAGIERILHHVYAVDGEGGDISGRLCEDELLAGMLALHGLHPHDAHRRIALALARIAPELPWPGVLLEVAGIDDGVVTVRATGATNGSASRTSVLHQAAVRAVEAVAPEIRRVELEGMPLPAPTNLISAERLHRGAR